MQLRYFIGVALPPDLSDQISRLQRQFFVAGKTMEPLVPHITLLHPGILENLTPSLFVPKIKQAADRMLPIGIKLKSTNMFDKRVLHIAVHSPGLEALHRELSVLLPDKVRAQYERERPFTPHVTLMQAKPKQDLSPELIKDFITQIELLLPYSFTAAELTQFTWTRPRTYKIEQI